MRIFGFVLGLIFLVSGLSTAEARLFQLTKESFASYLALSGGNSAIGEKLFLGESTATSYSAGLRQNLSGEFGFLTVNGPLTMRFGFEILKPANLKGVQAQDSGGSTLYEVQSDITGFLPKVGLDLNLVTQPHWRLYISGTVGQAHLTVKNEYANLTVAPNADFETELKGNGQSLSGGFGIEYAALDLTSVVLEVGYRQLKFGKLTYAQAVTDTQGAHAGGDVVQTNDGEARQLDFSGVTVSVGARWWLF